MHRSRISTICIDVPLDRRDECVQFWSGAVGRESRVGDEFPEYSSLGDLHGYRLLIQGIGSDDSRVHLDVHTDDAEAEVNRLSELGAHVVQRYGDWTVMSDPGGVLFCVVPVDSTDLSLQDATVWS